MKYELKKWNAVKQAIIEAKSVDEVKSIKDKAEVMRAYAKQVGESLEVQNNICEIKLRAERRMGEMLKEMPKRDGGQAMKIKARLQDVTEVQPTLKDIGIAKHESSRYQKIAELSEEKFEEIIHETKEEEKELTEALMLKTAKKIDVETKIMKQKEKIESGEVEGTSGTFEIIVIDPPWQYKDSGNIERGHLEYPTMNQTQLKELLIPCSEHCVLWLWVTNTFMKDAYELLESWGFEEKTILTWYKGNSGMGNYLRNVTEHCILAIRGKPISEGIIHNKNKFSTLLEAKKNKHSAKPNSFYNMIEKICEGRKLDYFARKKRKGWEVFGDEV